MKPETLSEKWNVLSTEVRKTWDRFTESDVEEIQGNYDILISKLQEKYGFKSQEASQEVDRFLEMVVKQEERFHL